MLPPFSRLTRCFFTTWVKMFSPGNETLGNLTVRDRGLTSGGYNLSLSMRDLISYADILKIVRPPTIHKQMTMNWQSKLTYPPSTRRMSQTAKPILPTTYPLIFHEYLYILKFVLMRFLYVYIHRPQFTNKPHVLMVSNWSIHKSVYQIGRQFWISHTDCALKSDCGLTVVYCARRPVYRRSRPQDRYTVLYINKQYI